MKFGISSPSLAAVLLCYCLTTQAQTSSMGERSDVQRSQASGLVIYREKLSAMEAAKLETPRLRSVAREKHCKSLTLILADRSDSPWEQKPGRHHRHQPVDCAF